jgi:MSHA biogenesis protein MshG
MPQFNYKGRDNDGKLKIGRRASASVDILNNDLIREGVIPIEISLYVPKRSFINRLQDILQGEVLYLEEMSIFSRQMQVLHKAGVPLVTALSQLSEYTRSNRLSYALKGVIEDLEKGQDLASSMRNYPETFSRLMTDIIHIGESSGHLDQAFGHLHKYLEFEYQNIKQIKSAFRYPLFLTISIFLAVIVLNIFVIPNFARFYTNSQLSLPWETRFLIGTSSLIVHQGLYILIALGILVISFYRYLHTEEGKLHWDRYILNIPVIGRLMRRLVLIRFCQSMSIVISSGIPVVQGLDTVKNIIQNIYIGSQIELMKESIQRGTTFTKSIEHIELFSPMELQILSVGEKNGELAPALEHINEFHTHEIEFDLKRMSDYLGPVLIGAASLLILIVALGVYLPIWNMVNLVK